MNSEIELPEHCTIVSAADLREMLQAAVAEGVGSLHIDGTKVREADVGLLQLLLSASRSLRQHGRQAVLSASPELAALARRAGLEPESLGFAIAPAPSQ